ncbi:MAG TPA: hypothetical protein VFI90_11870 [Rubrobacter sp.]|nr:hypothetical protein [Rubrobacter sp.]
MPFLPGLAEEVRSAPPDATLSVVYLGVFPTVVAYATAAAVSPRSPGEYPDPHQEGSDEVRRIRF